MCGGHYANWVSCLWEMWHFQGLAYEREQAGEECGQENVAELTKDSSCSASAPEDRGLGEQGDLSANLLHTQGLLGLPSVWSNFFSRNRRKKKVLNLAIFQLFNLIRSHKPSFIHYDKGNH